MTAGYLAALVERHTSPEPAVAPRARSAFEPDAAGADPFDSPSPAESAAEPWGVDEVDAVSEAQDAPRRAPRRRLRALAPEPMDEIVAPDPAPLAPPAPRRRTESTASAAPRGTGPAPARPSSPEPPPPAGDAPAPRRAPSAPRAAQPARAAPVEPAPEPVAVSPAPLRIARHVAQVQPAAEAAPLPRVDVRPPEPARPERGMDSGRPASIHPAPEPPAPSLPPRDGGRRRMDVHPAEDAAPPRRDADPHPAEPASTRRRDEERPPAALAPAPPAPPPAVVMVQPVVRSAPLPPSIPNEAEAPAPAPVIEVSIGRIEVRATQAPAQAAPVRRTQSALSLDDYLRRRGGGR